MRADADAIDLPTLARYGEVTSVEVEDIQRDLSYTELSYFDLGLISLEPD